MREVSLSRRRARHRARVSARSRQPSRVSHRVVVRHGLGARRARARLRRAGHVLPHAARRRRRRAASRSRRPSSCSRTRRSPIRRSAGCATTSAPRARDSASRKRRKATTDVAIGDWSLRLAGDRYAARIVARDFALDLAFAAGIAAAAARRARREPQGPARRAGELLLQPAAARDERHADGRQRRDRGARHRRGSITNGRASIWRREARGWDWTGINFDDGSALMAFVIRGKDGSAYWAGGALRDAGRHARVLGPRRRALHAAARWRSPRTNVEYPVAMRLEAGGVDVRARAADGRPGARLARERGHDLLGRRRARDAGRRARSAAAISSSPATAAR